MCPILPLSSQEVGEAGKDQEDKEGHGPNRTTYLTIVDGLNIKRRRRHAVSETVTTLTCKYQEGVGLM